MKISSTFSSKLLAICILIVSACLSGCKPNVTLSAFPETTSQGEPVTLEWSANTNLFGTANLTNVYIYSDTGDDFGEVAFSGIITVAPTETTTYTIKADAYREDSSMTENIQTITVVVGENIEPEPGSLIVNWISPDKREDGSIFTTNEIFSFTIIYGSSPNNLSNSIELRIPGETRYEINNLIEGLYYYAITVNDNTGTQSDMSEIQSKWVL